MLLKFHLGFFVTKDMLLCLRVYAQINKQGTEKSLNTSLEQDDWDYENRDAVFISVLRIDTEYLNDLNM